MIENTETEEKAEVKEQKLKERSVLYPYFNLKDSIDFTRMVENLSGRGTASDEAVASELGVATTTKSFNYKVSSAKQFGLLIKTKEGMQVSDRGRLLLHPVNDQETPKIIKECFKLPPLYSKLIKNYENLSLPKPESIANLMFNQLGITASMKDHAAKIFLESANFAKVIDNQGKLNLLNEEKVFIESPKNEETSKLEVEVDIPDQKEFQTVQMALSGGKNAKLIVPRDINGKDVERIKKMIDLLIVD